MAEQDRRKHPRLPVSARVTVRDPSFGAMVVNTRDISDSGLFVENGGKPYPPLGTVIEVQAMDLPEEAEPLKARIIRACIDGVGLEFLRCAPRRAKRGRVVPGRDEGALFSRSGEAG